MVRWVLVAVLLVVGGCVATTCDLPKSHELTESLTRLVAESNQCRTNVWKVRSAVSKYNLLAGGLDKVQAKADKVVSAVDRFTDKFDSVERYLKLIPKVGTVVAMLSRSVDGISDAVGRVSTVVGSFTGKLREIDEVEKALTAAAGIVGAVEVGARTRRSLQATLVEHAPRCSCAAGVAIEAFSAKDLEASEAAVGAMQGCNALDVDLPVPTVSLPDLDFLDKIAEWVEKAADWMEGAVAQLKESATVAFCCDNVLRTLKNVFEKVSGAINLALCGVSGAVEGIQREVLDALLNPLTNLVRSIAGDVVPKLNAAFADMRDLDVSFVTVEFNSPAIELGGDCSLSVLPADPLTFPTKTVRPFEGLKLSPVSGIRDSDTSFDLGGVGDSVKRACSDAWSALTNNDQVDCCDVARTCNAADRITLYEGNDCTQNIAGTLTVPGGKTRRTLRAKSHSCLANDEARSMAITGPVAKGVAVEVSDDGDTFYKDDFATVTVVRDIPKGKTVCIPTFERSRQTHYWKVDYARVNGLDGKVSMYALDTRLPETWATKVTKGEEWTGWFSEENNGYSPYFNDGPVRGVECSANYCDNKKLLQSRYSTCRMASKDYYWSKEISEESGRNTFSCKSGYYIGRFRCFGSRCDNIKFACMRAHPDCRMGSSVTKVRDLKRPVCPRGTVMAGVKCFKGYCAELELYCKTLSTK